VTEELKEQWMREMTNEDFKTDYYETSAPVSKEYESNWYVLPSSRLPLLISGILLH
jgi:hypothetical protein